MVLPPAAWRRGGDGHEQHERHDGQQHEEKPERLVRPAGGRGFGHGRGLLVVVMMMNFVGHGRSG